MRRYTAFYFGGHNPETTTIGHWATEVDSAIAFDNAIRALGGLFRVATEVEGRYLFNPPHRQERTARIDRLLFPTKQLKQAGWNIGPVGVELKRSGIKLGPAYNQAFDYSRATFRIGDMWIVPSWVFLFPAYGQSGPLESLLVNNRIGCAHIGHRSALVFHSSSRTIARLGGIESELYVKPDNGLAGQKVGSR